MLGWPNTSLQKGGGELFLEELSALRHFWGRSYRRGIHETTRMGLGLERGSGLVGWILGTAHCLVATKLKR